MKEIFEQIDQIKIDIQKVKNNLEAKEASEEEKSGWWRLWVAVVFAILFAIIGYTIYDAYQWKVEQKVTTDMFDPNHLMLVTYVWSPEKIDNEGKIVWDHYDYNINSPTVDSLAKIRKGQADSVIVHLKRVKVDLK